MLKAFQQCVFKNIFQPSSILEELSLHLVVFLQLLIEFYTPLTGPDTLIITTKG